jgi:hypothetical protein
MHAYHEAGHAVVGRLLGIDVERIVMSRTGKTAAYVAGKSAFWKVKDQGPAAQIAAIEAETKMALAGIAAQTMAAQSRGLPNYGHVGGEDDAQKCYENAVRIALLKAGETLPETVAGFTLSDPVQKDTQAIHNRLIAETKQLTEDNWPIIESVAGKLSPGASMDQQQLDALIEKSRAAASP